MFYPSRVTRPTLFQVQHSLSEMRWMARRCLRWSAYKSAGKTRWRGESELKSWFVFCKVLQEMSRPAGGSGWWQGKFRTIILFINHGETNSLFLKRLSRVWRCLQEWSLDSVWVSTPLLSSRDNCTVFLHFPLLKDNYAARTQMQLKWQEITTFHFITIWSFLSSKYQLRSASHSF